MDWSQIDTWPLAHLSRQVHGPVHRWHVQEAGEGPLILLLHGAGGSTHSFRDLIPLLAAQARVVALDLPGQGFTQFGARHHAGLQRMAEDIAALAQQEGWQPSLIIGHSAGCAIALRLSQTLLSPRGQAPKVLGINAALGPFKGMAGILFPVMAKILAALPFSATLFSGASANPARTTALISSTGSTLNAEGLELYRRLVADRSHVDGTLLMMAQWDLTPLIRDLPQIAAETVFLCGAQDATVPPAVSQDAAARMPEAHVQIWDGYGHLMHEEAPDRVAELALGGCLGSDR